MLTAPSTKIRCLESIQDMVNKSAFKNHFEFGNYQMKTPCVQKKNAECSDLKSGKKNMMNTREGSAESSQKVHENNPESNVQVESFEEPQNSGTKKIFGLTF